MSVARALIHDGASQMDWILHKYIPCIEMELKRLRRRFLTFHARIKLLGRLSFAILHNRHLLRRVAFCKT